MDARERFFEVRDALGLTDYRIYTDVVGVTKSMLDRFRQGVTPEISNKWFIPFLEAYPKVNANYILTGRGAKFLSENDSNEINGEELLNEIEELRRENKILSEKLETLSNLHDAMIGENKKEPTFASDFYKTEADFYKATSEKLFFKVLELEEMLEKKNIGYTEKKKAN